MSIKGIVYVPAHEGRGWQGERAGTQRVADRPLAGLILDELASAGVHELAVAVAVSRLDEIRETLSEDDCAVRRPHFIGLPADDDLGGALHACVDFVGDDPTIVHLATGLLGQSAAPIVAGIDELSSELVLLLHHGREHSARLPPQAGRLLGISELDGAGSHLSLAAVAAFGPRGFARAARRAGSPVDAARSLGTPQQQLVAFAQRFADDGGTVCAHRIDGWCDYAVDPEALLELNHSVLDRLHATTAPGSVSGRAGNRIEGRVTIHPSAEVSTSVIIGPVTIGARARVTDAYIGPYTTVGADAVIEDCEIVRSIVGDGACITHVDGRIEGSTIGRRAHIFRDFALPRSMRLHVGDSVEISLT